MADGVSYSLKGFDQYEVLLGDELRGERATIGKSLLDVQRDLKIKASYIAAIEHCDLEVFPNRGFIAGYVRSYARYLSLDPDDIYERFCHESGFANQTTPLTLKTKKYDESFQKSFGPDSSWKPGKIGQIDYTPPTVFDFLSRSAPVLLVLFILIGSVLGAVSVLKQVQRLDIVAFEEAPKVFTEPVSSLSSPSISMFSDDIYSSEELALPVFEPRDRALSTIKPDLLTALESEVGSGTITYSKLNNQSNNNRVNFSSDGYSDFLMADPILRTVPSVPKVKILAITPAWVRLKNEAGDVIFEKILKENETYAIDKNLFKGQLRAGNAQNVYFVIDKEVLGPLSKHKSVVKKVSLDPLVIRAEYSVSVVTENYFMYEDNKKVTLDAAAVMD